MADSSATAAAHHEANKHTVLAAAAATSPPPPPASNPLLSRGKLKKAKSGSSSGSKKPAKKVAKEVLKAKNDELNVVSSGGPDPVEEGEVLDLADQLLEQLGGQLSDGEDGTAQKAAEAATSPKSSTPMSPNSMHSDKSGSSTRDRLNGFKEDLKDAFMPNRNLDGTGGGEKKVNRQQARKLRKANAFEEQRRQAEAEVAAENDRSVELEKEAIDAQCRKYKVHIKEIEPDGHCMFSAVADQANFLKLSPAKETYQSTRAHAANYMRTHPDDFLPFLPSEVDPENMMSKSEFARYCDTVEKTAEWGGEPEIRALSLHYEAPIVVIQAGTEAVEHGGDLPKERSMLISYHRKMYGLGEHYNSLRPSTHGAAQAPPDPFTDAAAV
ncbi:hypothetical protein JCM6882_004986 [Rhodosporidiobolus microsporus]